MLGTPTSRVRELARDALTQLAPVSAERVDADWRGQVADYLLNQQSGPEATATRGHLKRSEPARGMGRVTGRLARQPLRERHPAEDPRGRPLRRRQAAGASRGAPSRSPTPDRFRPRRTRW